jgi:hypothetical protein
MLLIKSEANVSSLGIKAFWENAAVFDIEKRKIRNPFLQIIWIGK